MAKRTNKLLKDYMHKGFVIDTQSIDSKLYHSKKRNTFTNIHFFNPKTVKINELILNQAHDILFLVTFEFSIYLPYNDYIIFPLERGAFMRYKTLNTLWKELLFAMSGFGPGFLMIMMSAYFTDAINPTALPPGSPMAISPTGYIFILPLVFPVLIMIAKMIDGVVDIPLANITDTLKSKHGKRRLPIVIGFIPMVLGYTMTWWMVSDNQTFMTIWIIFWSILFFISYSNNLIAFYGSISEVCVDGNQRLRVSIFKAFFDTIAYSLAYALVPLLISRDFHIGKLALVLTPLMLTLIIPLFLIKEGDKFKEKLRSDGYVVDEDNEVETVGLWQSVVLTFKNKAFMRWMVVNSCSFFGLQLFLVSMNALIVGSMGLPGWGMAILNTLAFAPIPLMLYFFMKIRNGKGVRFAYQLALVTFSICIFAFFFASKFLLGENQVLLQYIIGGIGSIAGAFAIGSFLLMPVLLPSQIGAHEKTLKNINQSAMFFAVQALITTLVGSVSSGLIYEYIKMLFIDKATGTIVRAESLSQAATMLGASEATVFNFGLLIIPFIVALGCLVGFFFAYRMPRNYTLREVAELNGGTDILDANPEIEYDDETQTKNVDTFVINIVLYFLSGTIFGAVWRYELMKKLVKQNFIVLYVLSLLFPPLFIYLTYKMAVALNFSTKKTIILTLLSCLFILNLVIYIVFDRALYKEQNKQVRETLAAAA